MPGTLFDKATRPASQHITFETGGGEQPSAKSVSISGGLIHGQEAYVLPHCPFAVSLGDLINRQNYAFVWMPGALPFLVNNTNRLSVKCPLKNRLYADRIEDNVPIFSDSLAFGPKAQAEAAKVPGLPSSSEGPGGSHPVVPDANDEGENVDVPMSLSECLAEDPPADGPADDGFIHVRSMSKRALMLEAASPMHLSSHFPHNPYCQICCISHLRAKRYARTLPGEDSGLPKPTGPNQWITTDSIIVESRHSDMARVSSSGHTVIHTIRDMYSGMPLAVPMRAKDLSLIHI